MSFSEKIQNLRKESGDSQTSLAEKLSVSRQAISKWERGDSTPDVDKILSVCNYFNVSPDYLLLEGGERDSNTASDTKKSKGFGVALFFLVGAIVGSACVYFMLDSAIEQPADNTPAFNQQELADPEVIEIFKDADPISLNNFMLDNFYETAKDFRMDLLPVFNESINNIQLGDLLTYMRHITGNDTFSAGEVNTFSEQYFGLTGVIHAPVAYKFNYSFIDGVGTYVASSGAVDTKPITVLKSINADPINNKFVAVYDVYYPADGSISDKQHAELYSDFKDSNFTNTSNLTNKKTYLVGYTINDGGTSDPDDDYLVFTSVKTLV